MQAKKKNMERMAEVVPDSCDQSLQHFLSNSDWDARAVMDQVALETSDLMRLKKKPLFLRCIDFGLI